MSKNRTVYIISHITNDNSHMFGWTDDKDMYRAFKDFRGKKRYIYEKHEYEELSEKYIANNLTKSNKLSMGKFQSINGGEMYIISTENEIVDIERRIVRLFRDATIIDSEDVIKPIQVFQCLSTKYEEALEYLGYYPRELLDLEQSGTMDVEYYESNREMFHHFTITGDLDMYSLLPPDSTEYAYGMAGDMAYTSIQTVMGTIYSLEAAIKILREDIS